MTPPSYAGYRFPSEIIQRAVWMYLRFTLSYRDVEELLAERGIQTTYETIRRWVLTFGPVIARRLRSSRRRGVRDLAQCGRCGGLKSASAGFAAAASHNVTSPARPPRRLRRSPGLRPTSRSS